MLHGSFTGGTLGNGFQALALQLGKLILLLQIFKFFQKMLRGRVTGYSLSVAFLFLKNLALHIRRLQFLYEQEYATQQGVYESLHRDMKVGFGDWDFDPMDLDNPFVKGEGSVHLWQGVEDALVPISLQRYIVKKLPWIQYHELPDAGHLLTYGDATIKDAILNAALLTGDKRRD